MEENLEENESVPGSPTNFECFFSMNNPMSGSGRRGMIHTKPLNQSHVVCVDKLENEDNIDPFDMFQKNLESTEKGSQKRTLTYQPKKSEKLNKDKQKMIPIIEVEEENCEIVEMEIDEGEVIYNVLFLGPNETTDSSIRSQLKFVGTKKEGGFVVIDDNKVYFEIEWRDSANLLFVDEETTILSTGGTDVKIVFNYDIDYNEFKLVHESMAPSKEDPFL